MSDAAVKRTSAEIREDIGRTRLGLDFMIDALEGRLSVGGLIDEAVAMLRGRAGGEAPLGELIHEHPGPAALIAAGVVWMAIENRKDVKQAEEKAEQRRSRASRSGSKSARKSAGGRKSGSRSKSARKKSESEG